MDDIEFLKACRKLGVKSVKSDKLGLDVVFSDDVKETKPATSRKLSQDQEARSIEVARNEGIRDREARLAQMDIEDPHTYEQLLLNNSEKEFVNASEDHLRSQ